MRKGMLFTRIAAGVCMYVGLMAASTSVLATEPVLHTIPEGISVGNLEVGGLTKEEADARVRALLEQQNGKVLIFEIEDAVGSNRKEVSFAEFGITWANPEILDEIDGFARKGNVVKRYKELKDIENDKLCYDIRISVNREGMVDILKALLAEFEIPAVNATIALPKRNAEFVITEAKTGRKLLYEDMAVSFADFLENEWVLGDEVVFEVMAECVEPAVNADMCRLVGRKPMATFSTYYGFSDDERAKNVEYAASKIRGTVIYPGEEFSLINNVTPFTEENGYFKAGSYFQGRLTESFGGGVCQVSSTLYNAVLLAELLVTERNNHGLTVDYVQLSADAAIAESSNMDFKFKNDTSAPVIIYTYVSNKTLTVELYGYDTRPANRRIEYVHEILSKEEPGETVYEDDPELPKGTEKVEQYAHTGYKAELYKNVYVDGKFTEHVKVNESVYKSAPKYVKVGTKE
ncbi:MAG: VanW family protein [Lachnospiraceae bacterium]|nr:VanW family protein [Lachnospiraceae bacterium]